MSPVEWWGALLLLGIAVGLLAGLFGIGGGTMMVPVLTLLFLAHGLPSSAALHLALGSSMASIVATACASAWAHHRLGTIDWRLVAGLAPGVILGTAIVALSVPHWDSHWLALAFTLFVALVAIRMWRTPSSTAHHLPTNAWLTVIGGGIGAISALVSIGGGSMVVPLLAWGGITMRRAIGTSTAIGVAISIVGTLCYSLAATAPPLAAATGLIYLPAVAVISAASIVLAPVGARLGQKLPVATLQRAYALLLMALAATMLITLFR